MPLEKKWLDSYKKNSDQPCVLTIDLGGTKFAFALYDLKDHGHLSETPFYSHAYPSPKGKEALRDLFLKIVSEVVSLADSKSYFLVPHITMGSPGRFIGPDYDTIAKGSCPNLETVKGEFNGLNLVTFLSETLPAWCKLLIRNDAIAQLSAGLSLVMQDNKVNDLLCNQKVAYIGPGTGLGGGFCSVSSDGVPTFKTDGHIYDIPIKNVQNQFIGAQDVFSGTAFDALCGRSAKEINQDPQLLDQYQSEIIVMGTYLAELILAIYEGKVDKMDPEANWPEEDKIWVKGITYYLIGGSMGTIGDMGKIIRNTAQNYLDKQQRDHFHIIPIPNAVQAGLIGAGHFLSPDMITVALKTIEQKINKSIS